MLVDICPNLLVFRDFISELQASSESENECQSVCMTDNNNLFVNPWLLILFQESLQQYQNFMVSHY